MSSYISMEKHGFLKGRSINDVVASTQEVIHLIHSRNMEALILKFYLFKAYDSMDVVHQIGAIDGGIINEEN